MKKLLYVLAVLIIVFLSSNTVSASSKKLTINDVCDASYSNKVTGTTKATYTVKVNVNHKTYKTKANKKGKYSVKIPVQKKNTKIIVKVYNHKNKRYAKKSIKVKSRHDMPLTEKHMIDYQYVINEYHKRIRQDSRFTVPNDLDGKDSGWSSDNFCDPDTENSIIKYYVQAANDFYQSYGETQFYLEYWTCGTKYDSNYSYTFKWHDA